VAFDTGSGNLIVPGHDCESEACDKHRRFDAEASHTSKEINCDGSDVSEGSAPDRVAITFGTGRVSGHCFSDRICVSGACSTANFISSHDESFVPFGSFTFDGILGLARDSMAQGDEFSVMNRLHGADVLKQPVFSVFLSESSQESSEITFGEVKQEHMASDLTWVPVNGEAGYWEVEIQDIYFNNKPMSLCQGCRVAVDTGTSELAGPTETISKLKEMLGVLPGCSNMESLPDIGFAVQDENGVTKVLSMAPQDYTDRQAGPDSCAVTLMNLDVPPPKGPLFVFGIPFLQKYYTVYDHEKNRVGFALAKHAGDATLQSHDLEGADATILAEVPSSDREMAPASASFLSRRITRHE